MKAKLFALAFLAVPMIAWAEGDDEGKGHAYAYAYGHECERGKGDDRPIMSAPEIDASNITGPLFLLLGGTMMLTSSRRRRLQQA